MKNFEKYKTPEEAYHARCRFCNAQGDCKKCEYANCNNKTSVALLCDYRWLYGEAEKEPSQWQNNIMDRFTGKE